MTTNLARLQIGSQWKETTMPNSDGTHVEDFQYTALGVVIGVGVGTAIGVLMGGWAIPFGISIGVGVGVAIGASLDAHKPHMLQ